MRLLVTFTLATLTCAGCTPKPQPQAAAHWQGFAVIPPIADADPSVRSEVKVRVPTELIVQRTADTISFSIDQSSLEPATIMVGSKMITGVQDEVFIYPDGEARPSRATFGPGLAGQANFDLGTTTLSIKDLMVPGKMYIIEMDLAIFETDLPPQHLWSPYGKNFRILWKRTLKQTVE